MTSGFYYALCGLVAGGLYFLRNWSQGKRCEVFARLDGKIVVITGGNTGNFLDVHALSSYKDQVLNLPGFKDHQYWISKN